MTKTAVVIPCYRASSTILHVIEDIPECVTDVIIVDDACPEKTADVVEAAAFSRNISILRNPLNLGVGGAVKAGYRLAIQGGAEVIVKLDADGQMDPRLIPFLVAPIVQGAADYVKGNRFVSIEALRPMPFVRKVGNAILSFVSKASSGYWGVMDPTNGFTAIRAATCDMLPLRKISDRFYFESDMLFRLNLIRARVADFPMTAVYGDEGSTMKIRSVIWPFMKGSIKNLFKRVFYKYFLLDFNLGSLYLIFALLGMIGGGAMGVSFWSSAASVGDFASPGRVMLAALPIFFSIQLILSFLTYDVSVNSSTVITPVLVGSEKDL